MKGHWNLIRCRSVLYIISKEVNKVTNFNINNNKKNNNQPRGKRVIIDNTHAQSLN